LNQVIINVLFTQIKHNIWSYGIIIYAINNTCFVKTMLRTKPLHRIVMEDSNHGWHIQCMGIAVRSHVHVLFMVMWDVKFLFIYFSPLCIAKEGKRATVYFSEVVWNHSRTGKLIKKIKHVIFIYPIFSQLKKWLVLTSVRKFMWKSLSKPSQCLIWKTNRNIILIHTQIKLKTCNTSKLYNAHISNIHF
jgi:hypothetical protein